MLSLSFRKVFEVLELMKLDMANFTLLQARPLIQQHAAEYERAKFEEFLKTQSGGYISQHMYRTLLSPVFAGEVMFLVPCVCLSVCTLMAEPLDLRPRYLSTAKQEEICLIMPVRLSV